MALISIYSQFLSSPNTGLLADGASIHYVPTITSVKEPAAIIKHLAAQAKALTKKSEKIIHAFESDYSLCVEYDTTLELISGGGAYLPQLDDNFLADKIINFPVIHIVQFDSQRKISQIRLHWEQASILKQIEVIGSRGRNWPIRDGKDLIRLIQSSASAAQVTSAGAVSQRSTSGVSNEPRSHASSFSATGDSHASLNLFQPRSVPEELTPRKNSSGVNPRISAKPHSRNLEDILAGDKDMPQPGSPSDTSSRKNSNTEGRPKVGAGKSYGPIRLFDEEPPEHHKSPVKTNPQKYNHFEFGNGENAQAPSKIRDRSKHESQWGFEDFITPKVPRSKKVQAHEQRNFGWSDDEDAEKSPVQRPIVHHERPDSKAHFEMADEPSEPVTTRRPASRKENQHLYTDNVVENETPANPNGKRHPITTGVNVDLNHRTKDFGPHFEMSDNSPSFAKKAENISDDRAKVIKGQSANWSLYDESPNTRKSSGPNYRINIDGDGMGGRKGTRRDYIFGGDDVDDEPLPVRTRRQIAEPGQTNQPAKKDGDFWDF